MDENEKSFDASNELNPCTDEISGKFHDSFNLSSILNIFRVCGGKMSNKMALFNFAEK